MSAAVLIFLPGLGEIRKLHDTLSDHKRFGSNEFRLYPLHSTLSSENQGAVFEIPPYGVRKIVICELLCFTLWKRNLRYLIQRRTLRKLVSLSLILPVSLIRASTRRCDSTRSGRSAVSLRPSSQRAMQLNDEDALGVFSEVYASISSPRCAMTHRYVVVVKVPDLLVKGLSQMQDNPLPEMMRLSLSDLALRIKIMKVKLGTSIEDVLSRALDPPISINVQRAISMLVEVRALTASEDITPLGRLLSKLPTDVHLGKFLLIATVFKCLDPALTIAATLNSKSPFVTPLGMEDAADRAKNSFKIGERRCCSRGIEAYLNRTENSDFLTIHNAFSSWRRACSNPSVNIRKFCNQNYLSHQNLQQIEELRQQFLGCATSSCDMRHPAHSTGLASSLTRSLSKCRLALSAIWDEPATVVTAPALSPFLPSTTPIHATTPSSTPRSSQGSIPSSL